MALHIEPLGDRAVTTRVAERVDRESFERVRAWSALLDERTPRGVVESVPTYLGATLHYDPLQVGFAELAESLRRLHSERALVVSRSTRTVELHVCYGGAHGPDLAEVAAHCGLSADEVVARHAGGEYLVHMIGFLPGFPYLGGLPRSLATPRRATPRTLVPAGSVGIAGEQTGVYSLPTPGGWQLIGRTPTRLFRPDESPPSLLLAGDLVRFRPITAEEFAELSVDAERAEPDRGRLS